MVSSARQLKLQYIGSRQGMARTLRRFEFQHGGERFLAELREVGPSRDSSGARRPVWVLWRGDYHATVFGYRPEESEEEVRRRLTQSLIGWTEAADQ
jgi:hypothetical protein